MVAGCGSEAPRASQPAREPAVPAAVPDSTPPALLEPARLEPARRPAYLAAPVGSPQGLAALRRDLGPEHFATALKLTRLDLAHVRDRDSLVVPDSTFTFLELAPFPAELPARRSVPKLVLISLRVQAFAAYDSGRISRWGPTSTGRESLATPAGLYHANWKDSSRVSTFNEEWLLTWYVNLENFLGISLHQYELPGLPASHSCVRLAEDDARWIYHWVDTWKLAPDPRRVLEQGTPVVIFGRYAFGKRRPWKNLPWDSTATDVSLEEIERALDGNVLGDTARVSARAGSRRPVPLLATRPDRLGTPRSRWGAGSAPASEPRASLRRRGG